MILTGPRYERLNPSKARQALWVCLALLVTALCSVGPDGIHASMVGAFIR